MLKIVIPESDIPLLRKEVYNHPHPRVNVKMDVLLMKSLGFSNDDICKKTGVCANTMREYWKQYMEGGIERLKELKFYRPCSELEEYCGTIESYFIENPPASILEAGAKIEEITGIKRGETQVRKFLKNMDFKFLKAGSIPAKALTDEKKKNKANFWKKI
jgi:transposase